MTSDHTIMDNFFFVIKKTNGEELLRCSPKIEHDPDYLKLIFRILFKKNNSPFPVWSVDDDGNKALTLIPSKVMEDCTITFFNIDDFFVDTMVDSLAE